MDKGIGFTRNICRHWLDLTASLCAQLDDPTEIRARVDSFLENEGRGKEARRKSIDALLGIWFNNREVIPELHKQALRLYRESVSDEDRLWLHYGLTITYYPFFHDCVSTIGRFSRTEDYITTRMVTRRMVANHGNLGSLGRVVQRIVSSLREWKLLTGGERRHTYVPLRRQLSASDKSSELWLLACALKVNAAEELPVQDLLGLPALFSFRFSVTISDIKGSTWFEVQRQGMGWDMVRLTQKC